MDQLASTRWPEGGDPPQDSITAGEDASPEPAYSRAYGEGANMPIAEVEEHQETDRGNISSLCAHCQYICDHWPKDDNDPRFSFPHCDDILQLERNALAGCALCSQFLQSGDRDRVQEAKDAMREAQPAKFEVRVAIETYFSGALLSLSLVLSFTPLDADSHDQVITFSLDLVPVKSSANDQAWREQRTSNTKYDLKLAMHWLQKCRGEHQQCNPHREARTPTRLVSTDDDCMRVILRSDLQTSPEYSTLSHCWGQERFATLNTYNLDSFMRRIPEEALPKTFKDAVKVARNLGFAYIWIDSLCIMQDDNEDWLREAATMSAVYGGSSLNIAATGAQEQDMGCFLWPEPVRSCQIQVQRRGAAVRYHCVSPSLYQDTLADMPLLKRGWTLQARLLPTRTLHFTSTQMFWECHQNVACEMFPEQFPPEVTPDDVYLQKSPVSISMWSWIVEQYSKSDLTYATDKLVAISGLAREIQKQTRDQYVAGMWRQGLVYQLCWVCSDPNGGQRVSQYRAPSWSWASLEGSIFMVDEKRLKPAWTDTLIYIQVLDVQLQFVGADILGQVSSAVLRLGCTTILDATIFHVHKSSENDSMILGEHDFRIHSPFDDQRPSGTYKAIVVLVCKWNEGIFGFVLEPTKERKGQYRRMGLFEVFDEEDCKRLEQACEDGQAQVQTWTTLGNFINSRGEIGHIVELI